MGGRVSCRGSNKERRVSIETSQQHETVGRAFRAFGYRFRCLRWARQTGFFMRVLSVPDADPIFPNRKVGDVIDVSERTIGRTFHRLDDSYEAHEQPCDCHLCEGREA